MDFMPHTIQCRFRQDNKYAIAASTSHALTYPVVKVVHALLFDAGPLLHCSMQATCDLEQAQRGAANEFVLNQGPVVRGLLWKCR